jgi:hypothetical protein
MCKYLQVAGVLVSIFLASSAHSQDRRTPELLGKIWAENIREHSIEKMKSLIHPQCSVNHVKEDILKRMVDGKLSPAYTIETRALGSREALAKVYEVVPDMQLNIMSNAHTDKEKEIYGLGWGFPIAQYKGQWFFVLCIK